MTPKPAPRTVHHPTSRSSISCSPFDAHELFVRGGSQTDVHLSALTCFFPASGQLSALATAETLLAFRRSCSPPPSSAHSVARAFRPEHPSSPPHCAHDLEHLAMFSTMLAAMQLPQSFPPCDVPFCDLGCAAHTIMIVLRRSRSYVPLGGHVSCSSFDDHVMLAFTMLALAFVFRRSRSHPRSGFGVVHSCERPSPSPSRVHTSGAPCGANKARSPSRARSALVFRRSRPVALHRLTVHGLASSCHVSTAQSSDPLSVRGPPLRAAPVNRARARLSTITIALPYGILQNPTRLATCRAR